MCHDVAPVAGRVADRDKQGLARRFRGGEGLFAPGIPIDWIFGMLLEIETILFRETVLHLAYYKLFKKLSGAHTH
jgi:hypothetical protein